MAMPFALPPLPTLLARRALAKLRHVLPSSCALCGLDADRPLCAPCERQFFGRRIRRCPQCALPLPAADAQGRCGACLAAKPAFDACIVATDYGAPVDQLVLGLKFGAQLALAPLFARLLRDAMLDDRCASLPTLLVTVPLGRQRLATRGFNQALEIARPLSHSLGIALAPRLVLRERETVAQARLQPQQRWRNMQDAFCLAEGADLRGRHVGVVDDVITTGATMQAMASLLKHHGATRVTALVFARTLPK